MTQPAQPAWPAAGAFPFMPFPVPGSQAPQTSAGLAGGIDLMKDFWSRWPGGSALPGFMVPTVDVEELDKRIGDLKAAEKWVEVNLNLLRATIQGLEVQRHTIAAIQSLTTVAPPPAASSPTWPMPPVPEPSAAAPAEEAASVSAPVPNDWLAHLQAQFAQVAQAAMAPAKTATSARKVAKKGVTRSRKQTGPR